MIFPLDLQKVVYLVIITVLVGISNSGGLGGGGVAVPCLLLFFDADPKEAIDIAYIYIFFGAIGNSIQNCTKKHPTDQSRSLINFDLALVSLNGVIFGAMVGFFLNKISYDIIIISLLFIFRSYVFIRNFKKIKQMQVKARQQTFINHSENKQSSDKQLQNINQEPENIDQQSSNINKESSSVTNRRQILRKVGYFAIISVISVILILIKGSPKFESVIGLPLCGWLTFLYYILMALLYILFYKFIQIALIKEHKLQSGYIRSMNKNSLNAFLAGVIGSFLGIGGGLVLTANWLQLGLHPQENTATSTFVIIFTGFISMTQVISILYFKTFIAGKYLISEFALFGVISVIGSYLVGKIIHVISNKLKQPFLTVYLLQLVVLTGLITLIYTTVDRLAEDNHSLIRVKSFC